MEKLTYREEDKYVPIPPSEREIQTITADHFVDIPMDDVKPGYNILEGLCFDRNGDLYLCNTPMGRIYKINMKNKNVSLFCTLPENMLPSAIKIHKDGRLFVTVVNSDNGSLIAILSEEGKLLDKIVTGTDKAIDDMVFERTGGFYFTDLAGTMQKQSAGIFYVEPDFKTIHPVIEKGMIATNGIALEPDDKHMWVTEYGKGRLHHFELAEDKYTVLDTSVSIPYYFTGTEGPDSCCIDADGNLYVAMCGQGRFLIFNKNAIPIGQILIHGREKGKMLKSTHPAIRPGTDEVYMCSGDMKTGESAIFVARGYGKAYKSYQFQ